MDEMGNWLEDLLGEISSNENQEICQGLLKKMRRALCGEKCASGYGRTERRIGRG